MSNWRFEPSRPYLPSKQKYDMVKYTYDKLKNAVESSTSIYDVLRYLGLGTNSGGMHYYISGRIRKLGIDTSHFTGSRWNKGKQGLGRKWQAILINGDCKAKIDVLRNALLESGREEKCEECGLGPIWNGKHLRLQVDHINGNNTDNRPENIRFLCPNCHTQTPTWGITKTHGRRDRTTIKRIPRNTNRKCPCGTPIKYGKTGLCPKCANRMPRKRVFKIAWPDDLPRQVAMSSNRAMAIKLGVSDKAVAKRLKNYHTHM